MKTWISITMAATLLAGCGGGGGSGGSGTAGLPASTTHLDAYIGTWVSARCDNHALGTLVVARAPSGGDAITVMPATDYYANADCTGSIVATLTQSAAATATYAGTVDSQVRSLPPSNAVAVARVDTLTASLPQHTVSVTGAGVTHPLVNGQAQWCIAFGGGNSICLQDQGTIPAQTNVAGALWLNGGALYDLTPSNGIYATEGVYNKR